MAKKKVKSRRSFFTIGRVYELTGGELKKRYGPGLKPFMQKDIPARKSRRRK